MSNNKLQLVLPVVLNNESEPKAFLEAKRRIEELAGKYDVPVEVGAFLAFMPGFARNPANFEKQKENQIRFRLPIRLVETGVQGNNSLAYGPEDPTYNPEIPNQLESTIRHAAQLRDLDTTASGKLVVAPHVGVQTVERYKKGVGGIERRDFSRLGVYPPEDFQEQEDEIYARAKKTFDRLETIGNGLGLELAIENVPPIEVKFNHLKLQGLHYHLLPFNGLKTLRNLSNGKLVLDASHLAIANNTPRQIIENKAILGRRALFGMMHITNWDEYVQAISRTEEYLPNLRAIHISQASGMGFDLPEGEEFDIWGGKGTGNGLLTNAYIHSLFDFARVNNLPVSIEEVLDTKNLTYREVDKFLEPIFRDYKAK